MNRLSRLDLGSTLGSEYVDVYLVSSTALTENLSRLERHVVYTAIYFKEVSIDHSDNGTSQKRHLNFKIFSDRTEAYSVGLAVI